MTKIKYFFHKGNTLPIILAIGAIFSVATVLHLVANPATAIPQVEIRTIPKSGLITLGKTFTVSLVVQSSIPVNAFQGEILFDSTILEVTSIDYNTSIADLWVQDPWYSNGDGTINFAGGTTKEGGFVGEGVLLDITFTGVSQGAGSIEIKSARILKHDGLGTDADVQIPIDSVFTIEDTTPYDVMRTKNIRDTSFTVSKKIPSTDLNNDGKTNIADVSIFFLHLAQKNLRSDFNLDGKINTSDLSIILNTK